MARFEDKVDAQLSYIRDEQKRHGEQISEYLWELETKLKETHFDVREIKSEVTPNDIDDIPDWK